MKNISKKFILMVTVLVATAFIANAQSNSAVPKTDKSVATQQAAPEKFFNVQSLDDTKTAMDAAYTNYTQAAKEQSEVMHHEYLKAKRLYTVELEKQMQSHDKTTPTGQKIRAEFRRVTTTE